MDMKTYDSVMDLSAEQDEQHQVMSLSDLQLALVGGGSGDVVFA